MSGVHTNINMHLSQYYSELNANETFRNHNLFYDRVGQYKERIKNLHFTFAFVLKAINREWSKLANYNFKGINPEETAATSKLMKEFLDNSVKHCEEPFKENDFFENLGEQELIE